MCTSSRVVWSVACRSSSSRRSPESGHGPRGRYASRCLISGSVMGLACRSGLVTIADCMARAKKSAGCPSLGSATYCGHERRGICAAGESLIEFREAEGISERELARRTWLSEATFRTFGGDRGDLPTPIVARTFEEVLGWAPGSIKATPSEAMGREPSADSAIDLE